MPTLVGNKHLSIHSFPHKMDTKVLFAAPTSHFVNLAPSLLEKIQMLEKNEEIHGAFAIILKNEEKK